MMIEIKEIDSLMNDDLAKGLGVKASFLCLKVFSWFTHFSMFFGMSL